MTLAWMVLECGVAPYTAQAAQSLVLLASASDSLVSCSAAVVLRALGTVEFASDPLRLFNEAIWEYPRQSNHDAYGYL
jgi:hypothetical protein